jgi:hypothetical protein
MILLYDLVLESLLALHLIVVVHILGTALLRILNSFLMNIFMCNVRHSIIKSAWSELFVLSKHHLFSLDEVSLFFNRHFLLCSEFLFNLGYLSCFCFLSRNFRIGFICTELRSLSSLELGASFIIMALNQHKMRRRATWGQRCRLADITGLILAWCLVTFKVIIVCNASL